MTYKVLIFRETNRIQAKETCGKESNTKYKPFLPLNKKETVDICSAIRKK